MQLSGEVEPALGHQARRGPSGEAEPSLRRSGEAEPSPRGLGEMESIPKPSGEVQLAQRRRARRNQTPVIRARNVAAPLSIQKFLTFDGYWFHLLEYPGIRSPTVAPEPPGVSDRTAWGVVSDPSRVRLKDLVFCQLDIFSRGSWYPVRGDLI